ncbi:hypothetical protein B0H63DRAFT_188169 [Podospora didyma]|uniref:Rhodopsin domain-containing protein n=1 Tax=Podospora didyma TaxID=330526 RepID=A0AAE0NQU6_9PEZI|nr:hypothetical protein B0H63DRAFT_188169 [Podospora didyma]
MAPPPPNPMPPDENVGPVLLGVTSVLIAILLIASCLRLYVRFKLGAFGIDDSIMVAVTALSLARFGVQIAQVNIYGNGRHRWYISDSNYIDNNMLGWWAQVLLFATMCLLKMSICFLILRIKNDRGLKIFLYCLMTGLVITNLACIIILIAQCKPTSVYWTGTGGTCWDTRVRIYSIYFTISYSLLTDVICSLLPLVVIWNVKIPLRTKASVAGLMGMGILATAFGILRASSLGLVTVDLSYAYCISAIWSNLELFLGVIAANVALGRSIYRYFFGGDLAGSTKGGSSNFRTRSTYINQPSFRGDLFESGSEFAAKASAGSGGRRPSNPESQSSDIPLEPGIHKKTEFVFTEHHP